jgi:hypothetical protein
MGSMNLGIYTTTLADSEQLEKVSQYLNNSVDSNRWSDVSLFYNDIGFNPFQIKCGMFNSTDLWNFKGKLIVSSLECVVKASNIVNNIEIYYYYGWEKRPAVLDTLFVLNNKIKILCRNDDDASFIYRTTGQKPIAVADNYQLIEII